MGKLGVLTCRNNGCSQMSKTDLFLVFAMILGGCWVLSKAIEEKTDKLQRNIDSLFEKVADMNARLMRIEEDVILLRSPASKHRRFFNTDDVYKRLDEANPKKALDQRVAFLDEVFDYEDGPEERAGK